jgi:CRP-like cAMP-binding protein
MARHDYYEYLRGVPLFQDLDDDELDSVGAAVTDLRFSAGETLVHEGAAAHDMFIVTSGTLEVTRGGEHIADIGAGEFAGEMAILARTPRSSTISATTDVEVLHIDGRSFHALLNDVPAIAVKMLEVVATRVIDNHEHHSN